MKINQEIAYFIGVLHSDAYIDIFDNKKINRKTIRLRLGIGKKSLNMALKFKEILLTYFNRKVNLYEFPSVNGYSIQTSINKDWHIFRKWNNGKIPYIIKKNKSLFGAYLAGLIDGDGHIKIKNNKDRTIPQCMIRISSDKPLIVVKDLIEKHLKCKVHYEYSKDSRGVETCFYISNKNLNFIMNYIFPFITLPHKIVRLEKFYKTKTSP